MTHVDVRALERAALAKYVPLARTLLPKCRAGSWAVRLGAVPFQGRAWSDESNGTDVVAIIRDGNLVTVMYRRSTQPWTAAALRVQHLRDYRDVA